MNARLPLSCLAVAAALCLAAPAQPAVDASRPPSAIGVNA
jgi:hypothetical protein